MRYPLLAIAVVIMALAFGLGPAASVGAPAGDGPLTRAPSTQPEKKKGKKVKKPRKGRKKKGRKGKKPGKTPTSGPTTRPTTGPATAPATQAASQPSSGPATQPTTAPAKEEHFAVTGGVVHTVAGPDLHGVTILCKDGKIQAIGRHLTLPEETKTLDAAGMHIYPGLVACNTRGIVGSEPPENSTDVFGTNMTLAAAGGLTTVVTGITAAKTTFGTLDGHVLRKELFIKLAFKTGDQKRKVREALEKVRQYLRDKEAYEKKKAAGDEDAKPPDEAPVAKANAKYLQLIKKEKAAIISADTHRNLADACRLAQDFGIRVVIRGATEGWTVAGRLGRADVKAIVTPRRLPQRDERLNRPTGGSIENAAILYDHGVDIAITPSSTGTSLGGLAGRDLVNLPMEAAYAVRGGLPESAAIESITLGAARVLGIDDRVGSIEVGKDADFIVCDGELLSFFTTVQWTIVNGRITYDKAEESLFSHIRPRTPTTQPAPYKFWPRPFKRRTSSD